MRWLTEDVLMCCDHQSGLIKVPPTQNLVRVNGRRVLVKPDPVGKGVVGCPMVAPGIKPCTSTLAVAKGYSSFITIDGRAVCLDTVSGYTDGTPPGTYKYSVRIPGQTLVEAGA